MINLQTSTPRAIEAYLREVIRKTFGDSTENEAKINSSHGYYNVEFTLADGREFTLKNFRRKDVSKTAKLIRLLK